MTCGPCARSWRSTQTPALPPSTSGPFATQSEELVGASALPAQAPALGIVDRLAAPRAFVAQLLLFEHALDADALRGALEQVRGAADAVLRCNGCSRWRAAPAQVCTAHYIAVHVQRL
jgi:hypothetical protein